MAVKMNSIYISPSEALFEVMKVLVDHQEYIPVGVPTLKWPLVKPLTSISTKSE